MLRKENLKDRTGEIIMKIASELKISQKAVREIIEHRSAWTYKMLELGHNVRWKYFGIFKQLTKNKPSNGS